MRGREGTPRLDVRLLGRFELRLDDRLVVLPSRPAQSLFAYLILSAGTAHRRERLAAMLWPDADEENGRSYLRHALWRIRKAIASDPPNGTFIVGDDIAIRFDRQASYRLDVADLEDAAGDTTEQLAASLERYGGELLPGFLDEWAILERERLEAVLPQKMQRLLEALSADARWPEVIAWAERWISLGQAPESAYRALMVAHHEQGDRARTLAAYQRCVDALRREVDAEPSPQTLELYERLTRGAPARVAPLPATPPVAEDVRPDDAEPPFKGLQHFDEADADLFFGREELTARLAHRLSETSFLAVIGASGSGKSSLLRAGLVPTLRRRRSLDAGLGPIPDPSVQIHVITPTAHPLEALAVALSSPAGPTATTAALLDELSRDPRSLRLHVLGTGHRAVLVVDQFEELFTLCADRSEREEFVDNLLAASLPERDQPVTVVLALRADFYAHCAEYPALREALARYQEYIGPMEPDDLRRAIEAPAAQHAWSLEPGLVDHLVHEVGDEPGALPLLSHVLLETWRRREGRVLTLRGYTASGGVRRAIARTAEAFFEHADETQRRIARRVFVRLTELGEGTEDTRRRVSIDELTSSDPDAAAVLAVLRSLADARLVTLGERMAEVSHEALIREWPRLREWLDQDRELIRAQRHLTRAAIEWDRLGRDPGALFRGVRLQQALAWVEDSPGELTELERSFVEASRLSAEAEARDRVASATGLRRRARYLAAAVLVLALTAGAAVFFAEQARVNAAATELEQRRTLVESARAAAENVKSRLDALRNAIASEDLHRGLSSRAEATDHERSAYDLDSVLASLRYVAGPDAQLLFMSQYLQDTVVAVNEPRVFTIPDRAAAISQADPARRMLAGTAPRLPPECPSTAWAPYVQSVPYQPSIGGPPAVAMVHYGPPCKWPYALVLEVSLRRAGQWMGLALAPTDDAYLIDHAGRLLARARRDPEYLQDLSSTEVAALATSSIEPFVRMSADPLGAGAVLAAVAPVGDLGWRVIVLRPMP